MKKFLASVAVAAVLALGVLNGAEAVAQVVDTGTRVNVGSTFSDVLIAYATVIGTLVSAVVGWLAFKLQQRTGIVIKQEYIDLISQAAEREAGKLVAKITNMSAFDIDMKNRFIADAARALLPHWRTALNGIGVSPDKMQDYVAGWIAAHMGKMTATAPDVSGPAMAVLPSGASPP